MYHLWILPEYLGVMGAYNAPGSRLWSGELYCHPHYSVSLGLSVCWPPFGGAVRGFRGESGRWTLPAPRSPLEEQSHSSPCLLITQTNLLCLLPSCEEVPAPAGAWAYTWRGKAPEEERPLPAPSPPICPWSHLPCSMLSSCTAYTLYLMVSLIRLIRYFLPNLVS